MRITVDKVQKNPNHALSRADIRALFTSIPSEWILHVKTVHLGVTLPEHSAFDRPVIYSAVNGRLNVYCRGLTPDQARREILRELAARNQGIRKRENHLSGLELKTVDRLIGPILERLQSEDAATAPTEI